jgi:hypothetical protein
VSLSLAAYFLADEITTGRPLEEDFGGGYDVTCFVAEKPTIMTDYTFILSTVEDRGPDAEPFVHMSRIHRLFEANGEPCRFCCDVKRNATHHVFSNAGFWVTSSPIRRAVDPSPELFKLMPTLNAGLQVNVFHVRRGKRVMASIPHLTNNADSEKRVCVFVGEIGKGQVLSVSVSRSVAEMSPRQKRPMWVPTPTGVPVWRWPPLGTVASALRPSHPFVVLIVRHSSAPAGDESDPVFARFDRFRTAQHCIRFVP